MCSSDLACALCQGLLAVVVLAHGPVVVALALAALSAAAGIVYNPAVAATIPTVVGEDDLVAANALNATIDNLVVIVGPAVGAVLLLLGSPAIAFTVNAASFLVSAALVSRMRSRSRPVDVTESGSAGPLAQMAVGLRAMLARPAACTLVGFCALVSFVYGTDTVLLVGVSEHRLGTGAEGFGYLLAGIGLGGILMALVVNSLASSRALAPIIIAGVAGYCLPTALLAVIRSPELACAVEVLRGGSTLVVDVLAITSLQRAVPADQLARVFGVFYALIIGAIALGTVITPEVVHLAGLRESLVVLALAPFGLGLLGFPALLAVDRQSAAQTRALEPRVAVLEGLGIFATASRAILERLAAAATEVAFAAGARIVAEGDPARALFVLVEGEVEVSARGESGGPERVLRRMSGPTYFGEIGVLEGIPRTATVTAITPCRCEEIDGAALLDALSAAPPSTTLMENTRSRLALTHPSVKPRFAEAGAAGAG